MFIKTLHFYQCWKLGFDLLQLHRLWVTSPFLIEQVTRYACYLSVQVDEKPQNSKKCIDLYDFLTALKWFHPSFHP